MKHDRKIIYLAGFLASIPVALMSYVNSSFLSQFIDARLVGLTYIAGSIFSLLLLFIAPRIFKKLGGYRFLILMIGLDALSILYFAFSSNAFSAIGAFICGFALNVIVFFSLDELLKIFSKDSSTGGIRGTYLTLCNLAWVVAQLASGTIFGNFSLKAIYFISFLVMTAFLILAFYGLKNIPDPKYDSVRSLKYIGDFIENKNLLRAYMINFLLQFFYCWMIVYTPIYLYHYLGFDWKNIALIFTVMLLPFVFVQFPLGKFSDKIGERKILMFGFFIISVSTISLFLITKPEIWIWAILLFITRIGAATIEVMSDSYFFKHIKPENEEFVSIYRTASPLSYILGPLLALIVFAFIPNFNFIFPILGTLMLCGIYLSSRIQKSDI
jgi:MFS family permease